MGVLELTESTFDDAVSDSDILVVDWWAAWCGPCRMFAPVFEAAAGRHADIVFAKVDTDANPALSSAARIRSIPTLMVFRDGVLVFSQAGALPAAAFDELIADVRALDMDEVHRVLAERRAPAS
jgi:thioredoxin 1